MISFTKYIIESGISLSLFAFVYFLFLRKETFFWLNRWFLLGSIGFSAVLPFMHFQVIAPKPVILPEVVVTPYQNLLNTVNVYGNNVTYEAEQFVVNYHFIVYLYLAGVCFFALKLLMQLMQLIRIVLTGKLIREGNFNMVIMNRALSPFSFLNYIFVSSDFHDATGWEKILEHEQQHIRQGHTFDVLLFELIIIFQWFNPFIWMFRRALQENHEFLADQAVIEHGTAASWYKQILINQYVGGPIALTNNFNYSLIKIRMKMMSKIKSKKIANFKILSGIVLAICLIITFACEQKPSDKKTQPKLKNVSILVNGHSLEISSDSVGITNFMNLLVESGDLALEPDPATGKFSLVKKNQTAQKSSSALSDDDVFMVVEEMPEFPGGVEALRKILANNIKYPESAKQKGIAGKVYASFVIEKDGSVSRVKVARGVDPSLDSEAIRVVSSLPKWKPGKQRGQNVAVQYTVPINFSLQ
jgi:TonB family protein